MLWRWISKGRIPCEKMADGAMARVMLAHNPLLAKLVEEAGYDGIWAHGFELLASQALPDVSLVAKNDTFG